MRWKLLSLAFMSAALAACSGSSSSSSSSGGSTTTATAASSASGSTGGSTTGTHGSSSSSGTTTASSSSSTGSSSSSGSSTGTTGTDLCTGVAAPCVSFVAGVDDESSINAGIDTASDGTTFVFGAGTFTFTNTLSFPDTLNGITVQGAGMLQTILDFTGQTAGADGIDITDATGVTLTGFTVQNSAGNAIKVEASTNVIFEAVQTSWTTPASPTNGPYGIYPIGVTNLLVENCVTTGASDSGIYIGQSSNVIARNNEVAGNVAGLEIENTFGADVYNNNCHDNTAGILIFDLPNLPQQGGHNVRVFNNKMVHNNTANFGASGDIVSIVPAGTGFVLLANHDDEVFGNTITDNETTAIGVISYFLAQIAITDPNYYPFPYDDSVHDNYIENNGTTPSSNPGQPIGFLLANTLAHGQFATNAVPDDLYDGIIDPTAVLPDAGVSPFPDGGLPPSLNLMNICFHNNGGDGGPATFGDLNANDLQIFIQFPDGGFNPGWDGGEASNLGQIVGQDGTAFDCTQPALPPVTGDWLPDGGP